MTDATATTTAAAPAPTGGPTGTGGTGGALAAFDALRKGDAAPDWLHAGAASAWGWAPASTTVTLLAVSENATFLVRVDGVPVAVLRVARPGYLTGTAAFESEVAWVDALAAAGVARVAAGVPTASGTCVAAVDGAGASWVCVCYAYVEGSILEDVADPVPYYRRIGAMTALLHGHARGWTPPPTFARHSWELSHMVGDTARWGRWEETDLAPAELALLGGAQEAALAVLTAASPEPTAWGLVHADLRPSNIMISRSGGAEELTLIDFDDCGYSWYLYDFAAALSFLEHEDAAPGMAQEWVAGYREVAPFTEVDATTAGALSMVRRLQMLGWTTTHRADALPPGLFAAQAPGTVAVAERYLRSATWLLE